MRDGRIFLLDDGELTGMSEERYEVEDVLQEQLAKHTALLAGEQINPDNPLNWILIDREVGVPDEEDSKGRWSLDHLFIDQEGTPTLVEVKRAEDTRTRREVVAQMLDYAANSTQYWNIEQLQTYFKANTDNPEEELEEFLPEDDSPEEFWEEVQDNVRTGDIRMIFVADEIPSELTAIVEFLNKQMKPAEVLAVEVKQYSGKGQTALVPRVKGQTEEARQLKNSSSTRKNWDWQSMRKQAKEELPDDFEVVQSLYEFAKEDADRVEFGTGSNNASFKAYFDDIHGRSTFVVSNKGTLSLKWITEDYRAEDADWGDEEVEWLSEQISRLLAQDLDLEEEYKIPLKDLGTNDTERFKEIIREFRNICS